MHKELLILGLIADGGPMSGYDVHRIVRAHGELFADLKKPNMYYLLERLARSGYLRVKSEGGARGRRGERLLYALTSAGRRRFRELLAEEVQRYGPVHTGIEVAVIFLSQLRRPGAVALLRKRRAKVESQRERVADAFGDIGDRPALTRIAADHMLALIDAELEWIARSIRVLENSNSTRSDHRA